MEDYRWVVACIDFSARSPDVLRRAARLARATGARLTALHVVEHFPEDIPRDEAATEFHDPAGVFTARARQRLGELITREGMPGLDSEVVLGRGSATQAILTFSDANPVDLLVLGGSHAGPAGALGSTAGGVVNRSPCDVLTVRT
jgi:universal stress protein A